MDSTHVSVALVIVCGCDAAKIDLPRENSSFLVLNFESFSGDFLSHVQRKDVLYLKIERHVEYADMIYM